MPDLGGWDDFEDALLRVSEKEWEGVRNTPGLSGEPEFDDEMRKFLAGTDLGASMGM